MKFDCIPTETLIASALAADAVRNADRFGIQVDTDQLAIDFAGIMSRMADCDPNQTRGPRFDQLKWIVSRTTKKPVNNLELRADEQQSN